MQLEKYTTKKKRKYIIFELSWLEIDLINEQIKNILIGIG